LPLSPSGEAGELPAGVLPGAASLPRPKLRFEKSGRLAGRRFLVVEDEPLVALEIAADLEAAGAVVAGPAGTVKAALQILESVPLDGALLDGNLRGEPVDEVGVALTRRNVPFLFVSGYGRESLPRGFGNVLVLGKPFNARQLVDAAAQLLKPSANVVRLRE